MKENLVKRKLKQNEAVYGVIAPNNDAILAETIGLIGFDFYMLDGEHGAISPDAATHMVRACEVAGVTPLARIRSVDEKLILQFMDAGVMGVMMPSVNNADDVRRLVDAIKYPPQGKRGLGPVRAADYMLGKMSQAEYVRFANEQTLVFPQIEDIAAVKQLDQLIAVKGIDGFIIGPRDLAMTMGFYDGPAHPEVNAVVDDIIKTVTDAGLIIGTVAGTGEQAKTLTEKGVRIILNSVSGLLKSAATTFFKAAKS
jgi:4-hydroxy-2-oxoheptanedioate aldolase